MNRNRNFRKNRPSGNSNGNSSSENAAEKKIIIAERDNLAAVLENGKVTDFFIHRGEVLLGDVYLSTVDNILPSIDAAFVNVGTEKMGFLHAQDVMGKGALKDKLSPKQKLIVQVTKEPTGHKGPRVTTEISLPGRFIVLMPSEPGISVSKKIESAKERARLKSIVSLIKPVGVGVIIRTEAEGLSEADIQEDLEILLEKWNNIITSAETLTPPNLIYRDQDLLYRVIREACTENTKEILVDTAFALSRVQSILQNWHMSKNIQVNLYKGTEPILIANDIHKEIKAALQTKVNMPSGGYLYIQQTEALTVIDVNSGKFISSATQDETILKTNKEAVHEIARQLRLRNIGGMIIIDFIDMLSRADKLAIMEELEIALEPDKSKPQVGQLSDLGLVELTRHRQGQSLSEIFTKKCTHCQGSGYSVVDFKFSAPTAEGEYRAKAAKLKLPSGGKNNKNNKFNKDNRQTEQVENTAAGEISPEIKQSKGKDFEKKEQRKPEAAEQIQPVETSETAEIVKNTETVQLVEAAETAEIVQHDETVQPVEVSGNTETFGKQPKKNRRPNRGASKKGKPDRPKNSEVTPAEAEE
ncbi:MAG: Rne/Rng family ribonuclease [Heliobacteriaceae bacterium]|jgi:ribonuclease E|nr:Rne/Rng family ribonuclease [Heliobacteriaceae bacterium]